MRRIRLPGLSLARWVPLLLAGNVVLVAGLVLVLYLGLSGAMFGHPEQAPLPSPSPSQETMDMGLAHIPTNNDCSLCHEGGGAGNVKVVPAILHPIEGWRRCLTCHTNTDLGRTAPGHQGITEEECLNCHKTGQAGPAITQPHAALHDQHCLDCHGSVAHLPSSMASSNEGDCVLCHKPATLPPPSYPHAADAALGCRSCHQSPQVGELPIDHALRSDRTCLLCHDIVQTGASSAPALTESALPGAGALRWPLVMPSTS